MRIVSRAQWDARKPVEVTHVPWSARTGFMVHYSAASPDQTPKAIQAYHMDHNGWSDIGYNFLIASKTGVVYEGRGWDVLGAHALGHNSANIGVCVIGSDSAGRQDVSDEARSALSWLYGEACRRKDSRLQVRWHSMVNPTACPGDELRGFCAHGLRGRELVELTVSLPVLRRDADGVAVKRAQALLNVAGARLVVDGDFGAKTEAAVRVFQGAQKIARDGVVGHAVWERLLGV